MTSPRAGASWTRDGWYFALFGRLVRVRKCRIYFWRDDDAA
jgi:hypothetical protein